MLEIGSLIDGKYKVLQELGKGGTSRVYLSVNVRTGQRWALKEIRTDTGRDSAYVRSSLIAESTLLLKLRHPNLPQIIDILDDGNRYIIVREYIEGQTLTECLQRTGALEEAQVIRWGLELCSALEYLHSQDPPIIYRDMKPDNVIIRPDGSVTLFDFGSAREYKAGASGDTVHFGTQGYAAPEQYGGWGQSDERTDIFSLGVTLYHLVTGHNPVQPPYRLVPIRQWNPTLSRGLEKVILKCTQIDPQNRFQSCSELAQALSRCRPGTQAAPIKRWLVPLLAAAAVVAVLVSAAVLISARPSGENTAGADMETVSLEPSSVAGTEWPSDTEDETAERDSPEADEAGSGIHRYEFIVDDCSWLDAFQKAKAFGGYLARIETPEEYEEILAQIEMRGLRDIEFRVGGRRAPDGREYHWVDENNELYGDVLNDESYWAYSEWLAGEPSFFWNGYEEQYLEIYYDKGVQAWVWNDDKGYITSSGGYGFIVEYED